MPELNPYPGSPSLSPEARDKVLQTFRHTLDLARRGRNEEALLGCDFILKMDARFQPARKLLETLRGVAAGTVVDLAGFAEFAGEPAAPAPPKPAPAPAPAPAPVELMPDFGTTVAVPDPFALSPPAQPAYVPPPAPPSLPEIPAAAPPPPQFDFAAPTPPPAAPPPPPSFAAAPAAGGGLDDLAFDDFAATDPFAAAPPAAPATPPPSSSAGASRFAPTPAPAPEPMFGAPPAFSETAFAAPAGGLNDLGFGGPPPSFSPPATPAYSPPVPPPPPSFGEPAAPEFQESPAAPSPAAGVAAVTDPRIVQFLKQGDEALSRGQVQEAIDLWSRVFLIDLANDEASRRIDAARERQAESARKVDILLSEGITLYDAGDLTGARSRFLDVLAISEHDSTARSYLNQIDAAMVPKEPAPDTFGASADFMKDELEAPVAPAFAAGSPELGGAGTYPEGGAGGVDTASLEAAAGLGEAPAEVRPAPERKAPVKLDIRVLAVAAVLLLGGIGFGAYKLLQKPAPPAAPPPSTTAPSKQAPAAQDLIAKAQALFDQGKVDEALDVLRSVADSDPRHADALALIDKIKSTAPPPPPAPAPSAAELDQMRVAGLAAIKTSRYIDAVKALDPVVKAHPEDTEASQALTRAREQVAAMGNAVRAYNEQDYASAITLLWALRKQDPKNQDVEEFLFKSYYNDGVQQLQAGNIGKGAQAFQDAAGIRPGDAEAQRHLKFARKYAKGSMDLLARIYTKHVTLKP